jgi:hypothetical protein
MINVDMHDAWVRQAERLNYTYDTNKANFVSIADLEMVEKRLQQLTAKTGQQYVAVMIGPPSYCGIKRLYVMRKDLVTAIHEAYNDGLKTDDLVGVIMKLDIKRELLEGTRSRVSSEDFLPSFVDHIRNCGEDPETYFKKL